MKMPKPYDKSKCQSYIMKGYSGCMCIYCDKYARQSAPWKVGHHGNHKECEIFIARLTNRHAFASWGWDGKRKIIVGSGSMPKNEFKLTLDNAQTMADALNVSEGWSTADQSATD